MARAICRRLRRHAGLDYEGLALSKWLSFFALAEPVTMTTLRNGRRIRIVTADHVGRILYFMGDFQPRISWVIRQLLRPGDAVIDIGANMGWFTVMAADLVGPAGRVEAFEPQPKLVEMLRETIAVNGFEQVRLHDCALSDRDETMTLRILDGNLGAATLHAPRNANWSAVPVPVRDADAKLRELGLSRLRMIKIDVEGHEAAIFVAAAAFLREVPADVILFESNAEATPFFERPAVAVLVGLGYRIFQFDMTSAREVTLLPVPLDGAGANLHNDFVALHDGPRLVEDMVRLGVT